MNNFYPRILFFILLLPGFSSLFAQQSPFPYFKENKVLPDEYLKLINENKLDNLKTKNQAFDKQFKSEVTLSLRRLFKHGKVILNGPTVEYVNNVASKLTEHEVTLKKEIKIYVLRSSEVNAVTYPNGMIFVSTGLLAYLNNEAELAFVLAHEIAHYKKQHAYEALTKKEKEKKENEGDEDFEEVELKDLKFSREQELEADKLGLELFQKTKYNNRSPLSLMDILNVSDFPFENRKLERARFEHSHFKIPEELFPDTASEFFNASDYPDSLLTHPNIKTRKEKLLLSKDSSGERFMVSENEFYAIRKAARYEICNLYLQERDYVNALYASMVLLDEFPGDGYLLQVKLKALFYIQYYYNSGNKYRIAESPKKIKGNIQKLHNFILKGSNQDVNGIILRLAYLTNKELQKTKENQYLIHLIFKKFSKQVSTDINYFLPESAYNDSLFKTEIVYAKGIGDTKSRMLIRRKSEISIAQFCLSDVMNEPEFKSLFVSSLENPTTKTNRNKVSASGGNNTEESDLILSLEEKQKLNLTNDPVKRILVFDLNSGIVDTRQTNPFYIPSTRKEEKDILSSFSEMASRNQVEVTYLSLKDLISTDTAIFEDSRILAKWYSQRLSTYVPEKDSFVYLYPEEIERIIGKYGTNHVCFINSMELRQKNNLGYKLGMLLTIPAQIHRINEILFYLFKSSTESEIQIPIFNIESGKLVYNHKKRFDRRNTKSLLGSEFYYFFFNLKVKK